jgi:hypothetical protein
MIKDSNNSDIKYILLILHQIIYYNQLKFN